MKLNCWQMKRCGRETGGSKASDLGVCPAASDVSHDGANSGKNAGRVCWAVAGTMCGGQIQGTFADKQKNCLRCEVYTRIKSEEGENFAVVGTGRVSAQ